ncbi:MAG TPA: winged helix-turn-helix domain-containing protein [Xanthobacteraceae bacterium]|nr:winged helix-turn-helix domain-containing protein [Xanthobacteraceae bacterium]
MRYLFEDFVLDTDRRELQRGASLIPVAPQVFDLLAYLIRHRERVVTKDEVVASIWEGRAVSDSALTTGSMRRGSSSVTAATISG